MVDRVAVRLPSGKPRIIAQCVFEPADATYFVRVSPDVLLRLVARLRRVEQAAAMLLDAEDDFTLALIEDFEAAKKRLGVIVEQRKVDLRAALAPAPPPPEGEK